LTESGGLRITNVHSRITYFVGSQLDPLGPGEQYVVLDEVAVHFPMDIAVQIKLALS